MTQVTFVEGLVAHFRRIAKLIKLLSDFMFGVLNASVAIETK